MMPLSVLFVTDRPALSLGSESGEASKLSEGQFWIQLQNILSEG
jgi:hypothetical protein